MTTMGALAQTSGGAIEGSMADYQRRTGAGLAKSWLQVKAVVVVDISGSMANRDGGDGHRRVDIAKMELAKLQKRMQGQIAVVEFNYDARYRRDGSLSEPDGGTNLRGALDYVAELVGPGLGRLQVVVVSDGLPDSQEPTIEAGKRMAAAGARLSTVYCGPDTGTEAQSGKAFLRQLATAGAGSSDEALLAKALETTIVKLLEAPRA
jgi:hypothetical protein